LIEEVPTSNSSKGFASGFLRDFFSFCLQEGFVAVVVGLRGLFALLFQDRVAIISWLIISRKLKPIERGTLNHLNEARSQNLLLRNLQIQFEPCHAIIFLVCS